MLIIMRQIHYASNIAVQGLNSIGIRLLADIPCFCAPAPPYFKDLYWLSA